MYRIRTAGRGFVEAMRSNHSATSLSSLIRHRGHKALERPLWAQQQSNIESKYFPKKYLADKIN